ncbi:MAG: hypothetical protein IAF94_13370, partial [Pirellulaceae bacterium]|nr:hypothetical protein [Pirellulaceae bacterium]
VLRRIAAAVEEEQGAGAVPQAIESAIDRLIAFEMQLGPFAVAQLRIFAELLHLIGKPPRNAPRMFVTDTLDNPYAEVEELGSLYRTISESRLQANEIKAKESITVVIGNPPYKEKAKGRGGWVEEEPLLQWIPPAEWGVGAHAKHLRNTSISGGGPPGRFLTATRRTTLALSASSRWPAFSTVLVSSGCETTCGARATASG